MGKWYNHRAWLQYKEDVKVKRGHELDMYLPHVISIANQFPRQSMAIGCLDLNDLIQAGNVGLVEAWARVDHDRSQAEIWSFLKKRIKFAIRREIDKYANEIKIPRRDLEKARAELTVHEKILVNIFPKFFDEELGTYDDSPWASVQLEELIDDALQKYVINSDHREIIKRFYGIGFEKHSLKDLSMQYNKNDNAIKQIVHTVKKKLKNQDFEKIIENFYENQ